MIASFTHNFIFIKTRKTAGTSVEIVLSSWCSGKDICTPMPVEDELIRHQYGGAPQNFHEGSESELRYVSAVQRGERQPIEQARALLSHPLRFRNHMAAKEVSQALPALWRSAYKFTVDRHPYEVVVSMAWNWVRRYLKGDPSAIGTAIEMVLERGKYNNAALYADGDKLLVDEVLKFEDLWQGVRRLGARLMQEVPEKLPFAKAGSRQDRRPAGEMLNAEQKRQISNRCAFTFELLEYQP